MGRTPPVNNDDSNWFRPAILLGGCGTNPWFAYDTEMCPESRRSIKSLACVVRGSIQQVIQNAE